MTTLGCSHAMGAAESGDEVSVAFDHRCARTCGVSVSARGVSLSARGVSVSARFRSLCSSLGHSLLARPPSPLCAGWQRRAPRCARCAAPATPASCRCSCTCAGDLWAGPSCCCAPLPAPEKMCLGRRAACTSVQFQVPEGATGVPQGGPRPVDPTCGGCCGTLRAAPPPKSSLTVDIFKPNERI
jgi:hypothetical protein